jgi:hypothetical protein
LAEISGEFGALEDYFFKNKANFRKAEMDVKSFQTTKYSYFAALRLWKNKAKQSQLTTG